MTTTADNLAEWWSLAACRSADPDLFFPIVTSGPAQAQIRQPCLYPPAAGDGRNRSRAIHRVPWKGAALRCTQRLVRWSMDRITGGWLTAAIVVELSTR